MIKSISIITLILLAACARNNVKHDNFSDQSLEEELEVDTIRVDGEVIAQQRPVYRATETVLTDLVHTKLEVNFNWSNSQMNGVASITAKPHFYSSDSLILDAKGMDILKVQLDSKDLAFVYDSSFLKIKLNKIYTRSEKYTVVITYIAKPDERTLGGSAAISSDKGLYFINPKGEEKSKMPQIWTQGETEASSVWFPTIDSPNMKSTQEIYMTVDDKYVTLSNGKLISSKKNPNGTRTDYWKQDLPHAPYLFMMGVGGFKIVNDFYTRMDGTKMDVHYYVEPEWEPYAKAIFGETPNMIKYFSNLLGVEYAWDKYNQIIVRDYVSGAMENTGAVVFGDYVYKTDRELLDGNDQSTIAHELFHHWFGDLVTCESWSNLTLNESFANYSQYLWDEHKFGLDEAEYQAGVEADGYYQSAQMQGYHNLVWLDYEDKEQMFDGHSYNKGGRILHMLRSYLGDEAFFKGISLYLNDNKFKAAEFHQLRLAFEEVCGEDLNWFFNQWYLGSGHPVLDVNQEINVADKSVTIKVNQQQSLELSPVFKLPLEIAVFDTEGKHAHKVVVDQLEQTFSFPYSGELKSIIFDDQKMLLAKIRENKPYNQYLFDYYNGNHYMSRYDGLKIGSKDKGESGQQLVLDALNDRFWNIRLSAIEKAGKLNEANKDKGIALIKDLAMNDVNSQVRSAALDFLANNLDGETVEVIYLDRIEKDKSYLVISSALKNLAKTNPQKAMLKAKGLESEPSSKMISGIAQLYGAQGDKDCYPFFETALKGNRLQGFDQLGVMNSLTYFASRQEPEIIDRSFELYSYLSTEGGYYTQMFLQQNVGYLISMFVEKIEELEAEIEAHEKNKDVIYADQARKKQKGYNDLKTKFELLVESEEE